MVPFEVSFKCSVVGHIRNPAAWPLHGFQGGFIQLSSLLHPHLPLHPLQSLGSGHHGLEATACQRVHVAKLLQITLAGEQINESRGMVIPFHEQDKLVSYKKVNFSLEKVCL